MAKNHIFYKRFNFLSIAIEEYEVRDVANRADAHDLILNFYLDSKSVSLEFEEDKNISKPISLNAILMNESAIPAMYYIVRLCVDKQLTVVYQNDFIVGPEVGLPVGNATINTNSYLKKYGYGISDKMPIWQGVHLQICIAIEV